MVFASQAEHPSIFSEVTERINTTQEAWGIFRALQAAVNIIKRESSLKQEQVNQHPVNKDQVWASRLIQNHQTRKSLSKRQSWY